ELPDVIRKRSGEFCGHHAAERVADQIDLSETQRVEQVVVVQHEVEDAVEALKILGLLRPRMSGREDAVLRGEIVEEADPLLAEGAVEVDDRTSVAAGERRVGGEAAGKRHGT